MNAISDQLGFLNFVVPLFHTLLLLFICKQKGMPNYGVSMPYHFVIKFLLQIFCCKQNGMPNLGYLFHIISLGFCNYFIAIANVKMR